MRPSSSKIHKPTLCARAGRLVAGFTLIELLVVVAIIALLISILLPSLSKAREQAKAAVCASRLKSFGQASALYESEWKTFAPCDPWQMIPAIVPGAGQVRDGGKPNSKFDPAHGFLAMYGMGIKPDIPSDAQPAELAWKIVPYGFKVQSLLSDNPAEDLWQGFFCPSQNKRNTMSDSSPEIDITLGDLFQAQRFYMYASGYEINRLLRSPANGACREGSRLQPQPSPSNVATFQNLCDNVFSTPSVNVIRAGTTNAQTYYVQAVSSDEVLNSADTAYMGDSIDYMIGRNDQTAQTWVDNNPRNAGAYGNMNYASAIVLGARHNGKANVLYCDSHVTRDNLVPRNRRGELITASTFADWTDDRDLGSQHHVMPTGRRF